MPPVIVAAAAVVAEVGLPSALTALGVGGLVTAAGGLTLAGALVGAAGALAVPFIGSAIFNERPPR